MIKECSNSISQATNLIGEKEFFSKARVSKIRLERLKKSNLEMNIFEAKDLSEDLYLLIENLLSFPYEKDFHIRRICHAIEEGTYKYKRSKAVKKAWKAYKEERWQSDYHYGLRLRWQIRINRILPSGEIKIPCMDEIISHKVLRKVSLLRLKASKKRHWRKYKTLKGFYYLDRRYGEEILFDYRNIKKIPYNLDRGRNILFSLDRNYQQPSIEPFA